MDAAELAARMEGPFQGKFVHTVRSPKRLYMDIDKRDLIEIVTWLRKEIPGLRLGTATVLDLREGLGIFHHFAINGEALVLTIKILATKPDPSIPSLAPMIPAAEWIEREMHEMAGVDFEGHPDLRRLLKAAAFPDTHPLRREFDTKTFKESIGERPEF